MSSFFQRYISGECEPVWRELRALRERVQEPHYREDAQAVARETMRRARLNIETLVERLKERGYFAAQDAILVPPRADVVAVLERFEGIFGTLPLSVWAGALELGAVNFWKNTPLQHYDPLDVSFGADEFEADLDFHRDPQYQDLNLYPHLQDPQARTFMAFGDDCATKAGCSGDMYYYPLPCPWADFRINGAGEWFIDYLRGAILNGGFRGTVANIEFDAEGQAKGETWHWEAPLDPVLASIAVGLLDM